MDAAPIEIDRLTKRFGAFTAVDGISFTVRAGEVLGFLGPNGAGKSTTMKMLAGFVTPTAGTARIMGEDVVDRPVAAKRQPRLPAGGRAHLSRDDGAGLPRLHRARPRLPRHRGRRPRRTTPCAPTSLEEVRLQPIETLSKGFKRRVGLAQSLLHDPPVLVLDEPTDGLDPNQKHEVRNLIARMAPSKAIDHLHPYPRGGRRRLHARHRHRARAHRGRRHALRTRLAAGATSTPSSAT